MKNKKMIALAMAAATVAPMAVPAFAAETRISEPTENFVDMNAINGRQVKYVTTINYDEEMRALKAAGKDPKVVGQKKDSLTQKTEGYIISYLAKWEMSDVSYELKKKNEIVSYLNSIKTETVRGTEKLRYTITTSTKGYSYIADGTIDPSVTVVTVQDNLSENNFEKKYYTFYNVDTNFELKDDVIVQNEWLDLNEDSKNGYKIFKKHIYQLKQAQKKYGLKITTIGLNEDGSGLDEDGNVRVNIFAKDGVTLLAKYHLLHVRSNYHILDMTKIKEIPVENDFTGHWAEDAIVDSMIDNVIPITGKFNPNQEMSRANFVQLICNAFPEISKKVEELNNIPNFDPEFKDVSKGDWYAKYVVALNELGLINGYGDGTFRPNGTITRQEAAVVLAAIENGAKDKLTGKYILIDNTTRDNEGKVIHKDITTKFVDDKNIPTWCDEAIAFLASNEEGKGKAIISGYEDGTFRPTNKITKAESVFMVNVARP